MRDSRLPSITVATPCYFIYTFVLLLVPLPWVLGWLSAALIHELGHITALKIFRIQIYEIKVGIFGIEIHAEPITFFREVICSLSGPLFGICLVLAADISPYIAFSALVQSVFNLIPIYPMDGGRMLRCLLLQCFSEQTTRMVLFCVAASTIALFSVWGIWLSITYSLGVIPVIFPTVPIVMALMKNTLQTKRKNSTICKRIVLRGK